MYGDSDENVRLLRMAGAFQGASGQSYDLPSLVAGAAVVRDADGDIATYMGLDVMYTNTSRMPLPIVYVSWEEETLAKVYGPTQFSFLKEFGSDYCGGELKRKLRYHDLKKLFGYGGWNVPGMMARFIYRDTDDDEVLRMGVDAPQWEKSRVAMGMDESFRPPNFTKSQPYRYIWGATQLGWSTTRWFNFKAAYQKCGYYLIRYGVYNEFGQGRWDVDLDQKVPYFICYDIDFSEVGDITRITWANEDAKRFIMDNMHKRD